MSFISEPRRNAEAVKPPHSLHFCGPIILTRQDLVSAKTALDWLHRTDGEGRGYDHEFLPIDNKVHGYSDVHIKSLVSIAQGVIDRFEDMADRIESGDFYPSFDYITFRKSCTRGRKEREVGDWHTDGSSNSRTIVISISEPVANTEMMIGSTAGAQTWYTDASGQAFVRLQTCENPNPGSFTYFTQSMLHRAPRAVDDRYIIVAGFTWFSENRIGEPLPDDEMSALRDEFEV